MRKLLCLILIVLMVSIVLSSEISSLLAIALSEMESPGTFFHEVSEVTFIVMPVTLPSFLWYLASGGADESALTNVYLTWIMLHGEFAVGTYIMITNESNSVVELDLQRNVEIRSLFESFPGLVKNISFYKSALTLLTDTKIKVFPGDSVSIFARWNDYERLDAFLPAAVIAINFKGQVLYFKQHPYENKAFKAFNEYYEPFRLSWLVSGL